MLIWAHCIEMHEKVWGPHVVRLCIEMHSQKLIGLVHILSFIDYRQPTIPQVKSLKISRLICQSQWQGPCHFNQSCFIVLPFDGKKRVSNITLLLKIQHNAKLVARCPQTVWLASLATIFLASWNQWIGDESRGNKTILAVISYSILVKH